MKLATCRYIDFPGVGVIDLEVPQLPEKVYEVVAERMFNKLTIMEMITSVSKVLQEYERAGGFTPAAGVETTDAALVAPTAGDELVGDAPVPSPVGESREEPLPGPAEAVEAGAAAALTMVAEAVVEEVRSSPPRLVATDADKARVPDEPAATDQGQATPEGSVMTASPEIQEVRGTGASSSQGAARNEAQALELACTPWAAISESGDDSEDDEEAAARNTLEHGLNWAHRAFDELILPATSMSLLAQRRSSRFCDLLGMRHLSSPCWWQTLESSGQRRTHEVQKLRAERTQMEMQLVVARVATATAVASEASM
jgi:hypothetical protein